MNTRTLEAEQIISEATDWFVRLRDVDVTQVERDEFASWLLRSPTHLQEYLAITRRWSDVGAASGEDFSVEALVYAARAERAPANVVGLKKPGSGTQWERFRNSGSIDPQEILASQPSPFGQRVVAPMFWRRPAGIAAALALFAGGVIAWLLAETWRHPSHVVTAIGEQRSLTLPDGSIFDLNTDSDAYIELSDRERLIVLERGEARFTVAKDPKRPFLVATSHATVKALGTTFNVRAALQQTLVTVIEGRVEVAGHALSRDDRITGSTDTRLQAGEHAAVTREGQVLSGAGLSVEQALAWGERRLVFRENSLAEVVAEYNRYLAHPLRIEDSALASLRISGTFNAGDPHSLIQYLQRYEKVELRDGTDGSRALTH